MILAEAAGGITGTWDHADSVVRAGNECLTGRASGLTSYTAIELAALRQGHRTVGVFLTAGYQADGGVVKKAGLRASAART